MCVTRSIGRMADRIVNDDGTAAAAAAVSVVDEEEKLAVEPGIIFQS